MKCPHCGKDYNPDWPTVKKFVNHDEDSAIVIKSQPHQVFVESMRCRFCNNLFHDIFIGYEDWQLEQGSPWECKSIIKEPLISYPFAKTSFESNVPKSIVDAFNEAEKCEAIKSVTGAGACLRKTVYMLCDDLKIQGRDYREKITNLSTKQIFRNALHQIKWLGDTVTKPGEEKYTLSDIKDALELLPPLIEELYAKDERIEQITKSLAKINSRQNKPETIT